MVFHKKANKHVFQIEMSYNYNLGNQKGRPNLVVNYKDVISNKISLDMPQIIES